MGKDVVANIKGKTVLVTGGTGSFGKTVARRLLATEAKEIRILSRDELKQHEMRRSFSEPRLKFFIGNVRDEKSVNNAMNGVDLVFHAAALKQVPSCEFFPHEAVLTNIIGSENVTRCAIQHGVDKVVCLSTDKAVYPVNAMGMTKGLMEKIALSHTRMQCHDKTTVCCVRYGNVMYSRGSVIPLFVEQIRQGKPLTVTEGSMTRFMMPLEDAVDLVLFAFLHGEPGDIFVRKAPACTISALADAMCSLFDHKLETQSIGIRHGEKLSETLLTVEELGRAKDLGDYYRIPLDAGDLNYSLYYTVGNEGSPPVDYNSSNVEQLDVEGVKKLLMRLPEIQEETGQT
jgi:UDP-glucose 4-epimerase